MFDHVTIRASDRAASELFYELVLGTLAVEKTYTGESYAEWDDFSISEASDEKPATRRLHIAFVAPSRAEVDEFWRTGTEAGYRDDGAPGPRPQCRDDYYGSFLLDPDGNSAEAVHHGAMRSGGWIDHLWIRVADRAASRMFYETIAPHAGSRLKRDLPDRTQYVGRERLVLDRGRRTDRAPAHGVPGRRERAGARPFTRPRRRPATATTATPESDPSITRATTARTSSIPIVSFEG